MSSLNFLTDTERVLVADASVVINLNATGCAREIMAAFPNRWAVTKNALAELVDGMRNGHNDAKAVQVLIDRGVVDLVDLGKNGSRVYETLVDGAALYTLDDGEAATIGYAHEVGGVALIDERKAMSLCANKFPELSLVSTAQLLLHEKVMRALGRKGHIAALTGALQKARMRVPPEQIGRVVAIIGAENAGACISLPRSARGAL